jgi:hypothetical protein
MQKGKPVGASALDFAGRHSDFLCPADFFILHFAFD